MRKLVALVAAISVAAIVLAAPAVAGVDREEIAWTGPIRGSEYIFVCDKEMVYFITGEQSVTYDTTKTPSGMWHISTTTKWYDAVGIGVETGDTYYITYEYKARYNGVDYVTTRVGNWRVSIDLVSEHGDEYSLDRHGLRILDHDYQTIVNWIKPNTYCAN
jgi:hypothetical protein